MNYIKEERDEVLKHAIANIYYYLEMADEWDTKDELIFRYPLEMSDERFNIICLTYPDNPEGREKRFKTALALKLGTNSFEIMDFKVESYNYKNTTLITYTIKIKKDDYLNLLHNRLYDVIPYVDIYAHRPEIELKGIAQEYGLEPYKLLEPIDSPEEFLDPFKKLY